MITGPGPGSNSFHEQANVRASPNNSTPVPLRAANRPPPFSYAIACELHRTLPRSHPRSIPIEPVGIMRNDRNEVVTAARDLPAYCIFSESGSLKTVLTRSATRCSAFIAHGPGGGSRGVARFRSTAGATGHGLRKRNVQADRREGRGR